MTDRVNYELCTGIQNTTFTAHYKVQPYFTITQLTELVQNDNSRQWIHKLYTIPNKLFVLLTLKLPE